MRHYIFQMLRGCVIIAVGLFFPQFFLLVLSTLESDESGVNPTMTFAAFSSFLPAYFTIFTGVTVLFGLATILRGLVGLVSGPSYRPIERSTVPTVMLQPRVARIAVDSGLSKRVREVQDEQRQRDAHLVRIKREVQGWQYALEEGTISRADMETAEPADLQDRIDTANPMSDEIWQLREYIPIFAGSKTPAHQRRHDAMVELLRELREQPEEIRRKAVAKMADDAIFDAKEAIQSVRDLEEG